MLAFGDLAWVPFTYSLQAQFLLYHPQPLGLPMASVICLINGQSGRGSRLGALFSFPFHLFSVYKSPTRWVLNLRLFSKARGWVLGL